MKKILIIGSGGREHALAWKCAQSDNVEKVYIAPGNAGTAGEEKCENVDIKADDIEKLLDFAEAKKIDLTIVGPEQPLVLGIVDEFQTAGIRIFGPNSKSSQLEGSKSFAKDFLAEHAIPTADYQTFSHIDEATEYVNEQGAPIVIKADGLAAGKGVLVAQTTAEAISFTKECLEENKFGGAGASVVIEEFMEGEEASFICVVDGKNIVPLATSQDHKLALDGDKGLNTGGMGAYSPAPVVNKTVHERIMNKIIEPTVAGLADDGMPFVGFLYAGLMIDGMGNPRVVEFNVRFGDPETEPVLMRMQTDFVEVIERALDGNLGGMHIEWDVRPALAVIMAAGGYPESYKKGFEISGIADADKNEDVKVFQAGTKLENGKIVTSGGRVLCVTALGDGLQDAQQNAYNAVDKISWEGEQHRTDIGWRAL